MSRTISVWTMLLLLPVSVTGVMRDESLPPQSSGVPAVDLWTFYCPAGGSATVTVDTLSIGGSGTSPLDPAFVVLFDQWPGTGFYEIADDEVPCSVQPVCAFSCPQASFDCPGEGEHTILVLTSTDTDVTACGKSEGWYRLTVEVFDGPGGTGLPLADSHVRLGGQEPQRGFTWGFVPAGPAADDVVFDVASPPSGTGLGQSEVGFYGDSIEGMVLFAQKSPERRRSNRNLAPD